MEESSKREKVRLFSSACTEQICESFHSVDFLSLPPELRDDITNSVDSLESLNALAGTCRACSTRTWASLKRFPDHHQSKISLRGFVAVLPRLSALEYATVEHSIPVPVPIPEGASLSHLTRLHYLHLDVPNASNWASLGGLVMSAPNLTSLKCHQPIAMAIPIMPSLKKLHVIDRGQRPAAPLHGFNWPKIESICFRAVYEPVGRIDISQMTTLRYLELAAVYIPPESCHYQGDYSTCIPNLEFLLQIIDALPNLQRLGLPTAAMELTVSVIHHGAMMRLLYEVVDFVLDETKPLRHRTVLTTLCVAKLGVIKHADLGDLILCYDGMLEVPQVMKMPFYNPIPFFSCGLSTCTASLSRFNAGSVYNTDTILEILDHFKDKIRQAVHDGELDVANNAWRVFFFGPLPSIRLVEAAVAVGFRPTLSDLENFFKTPIRRHADFEQKIALIFPLVFPGIVEDPGEVYMNNALQIMHCFSKLVANDLDTFFQLLSSGIIPKPPAQFFSEWMFDIDDGEFIIELVDRLPELDESLYDIHSIIDDYQAFLWLVLEDFDLPVLKWATRLADFPLDVTDKKGNNILHHFIKLLESADYDEAGTLNLLASRPKSNPLLLAPNHAGETPLDLIVKPGGFFSKEHAVEWLTKLSFKSGVVGARAADALIEVMQSIAPPKVRSIQ